MNKNRPELIQPNINVLTVNSFINKSKYYAWNQIQNKLKKVMKTFVIF